MYRTVGRNQQSLITTNTFQTANINKRTTCIHDFPPSIFGTSSLGIPGEAPAVATELAPAHWKVWELACEVKWAMFSSIWCRCGALNSVFLRNSLIFLGSNRKSQKHCVALWNSDEFRPKIYIFVVVEIPHFLVRMCEWRRIPRSSPCRRS